MMKHAEKGRPRSSFPIALVAISFALAMAQLISRDSIAKPPSTSCDEELQSNLKKADLGDPVAAFEVARFYHKDIRGPRNFDLAIKYYELSGKNGLCAAWYELGSIYSYGRLVEMDTRLAEMFFSLSADCCRESEKNGGPSNPLDQYAYGMALMTGRGVERNRTLAFEHLLRSAASGVGESVIHVILMCLLDGMESSEWNKDEIIDMLSELSMGGDVLAMGTSRQISEYTELTDNQRLKLSSSAKRGFEMLVSKSSLGDPSKTYRAALCYLSGTETDRSEETGISYLSTSAELGNIDAMFELAQMHRIKIESSASDLEAEKNRNEAIRWYKSAENRGDIRSTFMLKTYFGE